MPLADHIRNLTTVTEAVVVFAFTSGIATVLQLESTTPGYLTAQGVTRTLVVQVLAALFLVPFLTTRGWSVRRLFTSPRVQDLGTAFALLAAVVVAGGSLILIRPLVERAVGYPIPLRPIRLLAGIPSAELPLLVLINPVFEEVLWLGYWYERLAGRSRMLAGTLSITLRTLGHLYKGIVGAVTVIPIGIILTWYFARTKRLWPIIIAHAFLDAFALIGLSRLGR